MNLNCIDGATTGQVVPSGVRKQAEQDIESRSVEQRCSVNSASAPDPVSCFSFCPDFPPLSHSVLVALVIVF